MDDTKIKEIKAIKKDFKNNTSYKYLLELMEVLSNKDRFLILNIINENPCLLSDIEENLSKSQASIAHHLRVLEKHKLIRSSKKGKFKKYSIFKETFVKLLSIWNQWVKGIQSEDYY